MSGNMECSWMFICQSLCSISEIAPASISKVLHQLLQCAIILFSDSLKLKTLRAVKQKHSLLAREPRVENRR